MAETKTKKATTTTKVAKNNKKVRITKKSNEKID